MTVLGIGKSGLAAAKLGKKQGLEVFASDFSTKSDEDDAIIELKNFQIDFEIGGHSDRIYETDLCVLSPGIKKELPVVRGFYDRSIPVISEIEFATRFSKNKFTAITGSNGKTTTTTLLGRMYEAEFGEKLTAGNIGIPLSDIVNDSSHPIALELSSFQIETLDQFKPNIAVFLNVSPNHLDWYDHYDDYVKAKIELTKNMDVNDLIIYNLDDQRLSHDLSDKASRKIDFSLNQEADATLRKDNIYFKAYDFKLSLEQMQLKGPHHLYNYMAATLAALEHGVKKETIENIVYQFNGLEHRMESMGIYREKTFYNDSKSTSVAALSMALQSFDEKIILICGGKHKGASYEPLNDLIRARTKLVYVFGESAKMMYDTWKNIGHVEIKETVFDVLDEIKTESGKDIILFSPACSSFDQFKNYEERGNQFKDAVKQKFGES